MADAVTSTVIADGPRNYIIKLTNISDGTGESAVAKVDISALVGPDGINAPSYFAVKHVEWAIQGMTRVELLFDATTDDKLMIMNPGNGYHDFGEAFLNDPQSTGATGDIKLTTTGAASGGSYDITLTMVKKQ